MSPSLPRTHPASQPPTSWRRENDLVLVSSTYPGDYLDTVPEGSHALGMVESVMSQGIRVRFYLATDAYKVRGHMGSSKARRRKHGEAPGTHRDGGS